MGRLFTFTTFLLYTSPIMAAPYLGQAFMLKPQPYSLLFTNTEQQQLSQAYPKQRLAPQLAEANMLQLNAIIYTDENNWTLWINGQSITANHPSPMLTVHKITQQHIHCTWHHAQGDFEIMLGPNQSFRADTMPKLNGYSKS